MKLKEKLSKNDLSIKLISLVMAILLWSYVMGIENPVIERTYRGIDVDVTGEAYLQREGLSVVSPEDPKVSVKVSGTRKNLNELESSNILAELSLDGMKAGENKGIVTVSIKQHSGGVEVVNVEPSNVVVTLDEIVTENLRITPVTLGELEESYTLGNVRVLNNYVRVTAPKSVIDQIENTVVYADITGKTDTFMINGPIVFLDKNDNEIKNLDTNMEYTEVEVPIYKIKSVPIRPNIVGEIDEDERISNVEVVPENVVIRGSKDAIDSVDSIITEPIQKSDLLGSTTQEVNLRLPEGISLHDGNLDVHLEYEYLNYVEKTFSIPKENFNLNNENLEYNYKISPSVENLSVIIYGESEDIDDLKGDNIQVYIDVGNLSPGNYAIEPKLENINDLTIREINPSTIEVIISEKSEITSTTDEGNETDETVEEDNSLNN